MISLPSSFSRTGYHWLALGLIVVVAVIAYANTFDVPFIFDDHQNIENNRHLRLTELSIADLSRAATESPAKHRWLPNLSFALNYYWHGPDVRGYHLINLLIHIGCGLALYSLCLTTLELPVLRHRFSQPFEIALLTALVWTAHPLQTNAVTYIVQRMTSLAALFVLLAVLTYARGRRPTQPLGHRLAWFGASLVSGLLALASKENAAMLPILLAGYELFFLPVSDHGRQGRRIILLVAGSLTLLTLLALAFTNASPWDAILAGYDRRPFSPLERLLTQARVFWLYMSLLAWPLPGRLNLNHEFPLSHSLWSPISTLMAVLAIALLIAAAIGLYRRHRLPAFAVFWLLANLAIESTLVPLELVYEHRLYLPPVFLLLTAVGYLYLWLPQRLVLIRTVALTCLVLLTVMTMARNRVWQNEVNLWQDVLAKSPGIPRVYDYLAKAYVEEGRYDEGFKVFSLAHAKGLANTHLYVDWAKAAFEQGQADQAITYLKWAIRLDPRNGEAHYNLGILYGNQGLVEQARQEMALGLQLQNAQRL